MVLLLIESTSWKAEYWTIPLAQHSDSPILLLAENN